MVEAKCLSSASHIEAYITQKVPSEYVEQTIQPFIVNDSLQTLYMVFYDPRIPAKDFFFLTIKREDYETEIVEYLKYQQEELKLVDDWVLKLTF